MDTSKHCFYWIKSWLCEKEKYNQTSFIKGEIARLVAAITI
jgi:hypothetical protein